MGLLKKHNTEPGQGTKPSLINTWARDLKRVSAPL